MIILIPLFFTQILNYFDNTLLDLPMSVHHLFQYKLIGFCVLKDTSDFLAVRKSSNRIKLNFLNHELILMAFLRFGLQGRTHTNKTFASLFENFTLRFCK